MFYFKRKLYAFVPKTVVSVGPDHGRLIFPFVSHAAGNGFFTRPVDNELKRKITGVSFPDTEEPSEISYDDLAYIHVLHYDLTGRSATAI